MPKERTALVDGDIVCYRAGFAAEKKHYTVSWKDHGLAGVEYFVGKKAMNDWLKEHEPEEYEWTSELIVEPVSYCLATVKHMLKNIREAGKATDVKVFLSDENNFRHDVATVAKYKGNRDDKRKPMHYERIMDYLKEQHDAIIVPNMEADDMLADTQLTWNEAGRDTYIASIDKDLLQIPGKHYNFVDETFQIITPEQGTRKLYEQMLTGDRTDNIPGIKGLGPVKAAKLLEDCETEEDMYEVVFEEWDRYLSQDPDGEASGIGYDKDEEHPSPVLCYPHWDDGAVYIDVPLSDFLDELKKLLTVGVPQGDTNES